MMPNYDELIRNLEIVIDKESKKTFHSTGEIRIDWMAKDCMNAIIALRARADRAERGQDAIVKDFELVGKIHHLCGMCKGPEKCDCGTGYPADCGFKYRGIPTGSL
jgi:hypothetical protein